MAADRESMIRAGSGGGALRSMRYFAQRWLLGREFAVAPARYFDLMFRVRLADNQGRHIFRRGAHEPDITEYLLRHLQFSRGDVLLDIGANIGWYSLLLDRLAPAGAEIFSFEPHPANHALLLDNLARNAATKVRAQRLALSDRAGRLPMYEYKRSNFGRHSLLPINSSGRIEIEAQTLDEFWDSQALGGRCLRFVKMDIEGYELMALRGATRCMRNCRMLMMEYSPALMRRAGLEPRELLELLAQFGLRTHRLRDGRLEPVAFETLAASSDQVNLFCLRE